MALWKAEHKRQQRQQQRSVGMVGPAGRKTSSPVAPVDWHPDIPDAEECGRIFESLTPRQQQVVALVAGGYAKKEMARLLGVTDRTVDEHLYRLSQVTGLPSPMRTLSALYWRAAFVETLPLRRAG